MKEPASDLATLVLALVVAALARVDTAAGLLASYAGAWAIVNAVRVFGWPKAPIAMPRAALVLGVIVVAAVPLRDLAARWRTLMGNEAWAGLGEHVGDRRALEADPAIAPALVSSDRPQTYFVRASGAHVRVRLGEGVEWIEAEGLGHGVFRVDYDPRAHGRLDAHVHETDARIEVDGAVSVRTMLAVTPSPHPRWLRSSRDRAHVCVPSEETDEVVVIAEGQAERRIETLDGPTDCAIDDDGALTVSHRYAREILRVASDGARTTSEVGIGAVALARVGDRTCVALQRGEVCCAGLPPLPIEGVPVFLVPLFGPGALVLATRSPAALIRIDVTDAGLAVGARRPLATPAVFVAADPVGYDLFVALADFDADGHAGLGNHFVQDRIARFDDALRLEEDYLTTWRTERQDHAGDVDRGASPIGITTNADGTRWVAFAGTGEIERLGDARPIVIDVRRDGLASPFSVVELANRQLVVTSPSSALVAILDEHGELVRRIALAESDAALLHDDPDALQLRFGERAFYEATRSGVSCQSCHLHGGTDGATHNIGGRIAAPTLDVRGLLGTSPYLRDGSYPRLRDLHEVAELEYRGYRESAGDRGATIEAWLRTVPPPPTFEPRDPALEREGLGVFFEAGCPTCHAPPAFTSLGSHALASVFPDAASEAPDDRLLDVPSLRGVATSPPHLYDGRAETLEALLTEHNRSDRHGRTQDLDAHARAALMAFVRSL